MADTFVPPSPPLRVAVFDYRAGNLHSLVKALETPFTDVRVEPDPVAAARDADVLVLPGVGAFTPAAEALASGRDAMRDAIADGMPVLGICLGMQLLFDASDEGAGTGLGVLPGSVTRLDADRVPQIGWNVLEPSAPLDPLLRESGLESVYYANSFACRPVGDAARNVIAWTTHERDRLPAAVRVGAVVGTQFHPEKSSAAGVAFVRAFLREAAGHALARRAERATTVTEGA